MAPPKKWTPSPAVEKLPLAVRKELRDDWESVKGDHEAKISELLGKPYVLAFNANEVYPYADSSSSKEYPGRVFVGYVEGLIAAIQWYLDEFEEDGKIHFNDAVSKGEITLVVDEKGSDGPVCSADIKDGVFRIIFRYDCLGYNQQSTKDYIVAAVDSVPREGFPVEVKNSIRSYYDPEIDEVRQQIADILALPDVVLDANFTGVYEAMLAGKPSSRSWKSEIGKVALANFKEGLLNSLEKQGFKGDDMLQEGLAEVLTSKTFKLSVVPKLEKGSVNETFVRDGVCYLQTTPDNWWYNVPNMGDGLVNLL
ncbi:hypothetical protein HGRIS_009265 [Hohenbuehelia grisea]|uniref:Uncharacterized protein n=1 Tax=Hohenbuehelia grisea TaxID=104357 RepID=A0ABR3J125_9AGAR